MKIRIQFNSEYIEREILSDEDLKITIHEIKSNYKTDLIFKYIDKNLKMGTRNRFKDTQYVLSLILKNNNPKIGLSPDLAKITRDPELKYFVLSENGQWLWTEFPENIYGKHEMTEFQKCEKAFSYAKQVDDFFKYEFCELLETERIFKIVN